MFVTGFVEVIGFLDATGLEELLDGTEEEEGSEEITELTSSDEVTLSFCEVLPCAEELSLDFVLLFPTKTTVRTIDNISTAETTAE